MTVDMICNSTPMVLMDIPGNCEISISNAVMQYLLSLSTLTGGPDLGPGVVGLTVRGLEDDRD